MQAELVLDARAGLGEGPLWDARTGELLWVDIMAGLLHRFDPATGNDVALHVGRPIGCVVPRARGGLMLGVQEGFAAVNGAFELVAPLGHRPDLRMNDGACDSAGRFWAGTMQLDEERGAGSLYRLDPDGVVHTMLTGVTISNGIAWSPDDTVMYYVDTPTQLVEAFDYDADSGAIANRRTIAEIDRGSPDGLVVDAEGCIWVALWGGWAVRRYAPGGTLLDVVEVPTANVTKPAFGGPGLDELYITTAAGDGENAGGVFLARPGVRGLAARPFAG